MTNSLSTEQKEDIFNSYNVLLKSIKEQPKAENFSALRAYVERVLNDKNLDVTGKLAVITIAVIGCERTARGALNTTFTEVALEVLREGW